MRTRGTFIACALFLALAAAASSVPENARAAAPQDPSGLSSPAAIVKPHVFVSLAPVPRGKEFEVALVVDIARNYHMNSHHPSDQYLIPTTLTPKIPAGFALLDT
ncbi:MAG: hypothetical protein WA192_15475, partial [Candidatus Acidiferrales bacterium]